MRWARTLAGCALLLGFAGAAHAQNGCARLSWGTCDPWVEDRNYTGPAVYPLVYSMFGVSAANVGTDSQIRIRHFNFPGAGGYSTPDAWRFDDSGCQGGSQLSLNNNPLSKACPAMKGTNPLTITQYALDVDGSAFLRLAITYDNFTPSASTRYTVWNILFDHSFSTVGPSDPGNTCGGAELCENFSFDFAGVLAVTGQLINLPACDRDVYYGAFDGTVALWNGGCVIFDPAEPTTWGKVKAHYRGQ